MAKCAECGACFTRSQYKQVFCQPACKQAFHNRSAKRGKTLVPLLLAWRGDRTGGKQAFREACAAISRFNAEDKEAGRMPASEFVARQHKLWLRS